MCSFEGAVEIQTISAHKEPFETKINGPYSCCKGIGNPINDCSIFHEPDIIYDNQIIGDVIKVRDSIDVQSLD